VQGVCRIIQHLWFWRVHGARDATAAKLLRERSFRGWLWTIQREEWKGLRGSFFVYFENVYISSGSRYGLWILDLFI
jgi:hypothetical protein